MIRWVGLALALTATTLWAQTDEELFGAPPPDVTTDEGAKVDLSPILAPAGPSLGGSIVSSGGVFVGQDIDNNWAKGFGYDFTSSLTLDARPDATLHWSATLQSNLPVGSSNWSTPTLSSMYVDYTLLDRVFFTVGRFTGAWGVGRLFSVNDLLTPLGNGVALKAFTPMGPVGVTAVTMVPPGATQFGQLSMAGQAEMTFGAWNFVFAGERMDAAGPKLDASVKAAAFGADWFSEAQASWRSGAVPTVAALAGFYWEGFEPKLHLQAEWMVDGATHSWLDQSFGLALGWAVLPGWGVKPSAKFIYALVDRSGQLLVGLEADPVAHVHMTVGLPFGWGASTSRWVVNTVKDYRLPIAMALKVDLTAQF